MAATGFTPIQIYYSETAAATPSGSNLVAGELAINTADGKLFYKDSGGTVRVIANVAYASGNAEALKNTGSVSTNSTFFVTFADNNTTSYQASKTSAALSLNPSTGTLFVGNTAALGGTTNPLIAMSGSANNYVQSYIRNASTGTSASADLVAYADNSTDSSGWADIGYTSSTYSDATFSVTGPNEAYVFSSAPTGAGKTGNLVYATDSTGSANAHQWYVGGFNQAKGAWKMQLTSSGLSLASALGVASGGTGLTSLTAGRIPFGAGTSAFGSTSSLFWNNSNEALSIGTSTPKSGPSFDSYTTSLGVESASGGTGVSIYNFSASGTLGPIFVLGKSNGGTVGTISTTSSGDSLGTLSFEGCNAGSRGAALAIAAYIRCQQDGAATDPYVPGRFVFYTTDTTNGNTEKMRLTSAGGLSVGTTADPGAGAIYATGNITAYYSSDRSLKENIQDVPNALDKVCSIGSKTFDWTDEYIASKGGEDGYFVQKSDFGVIAQDVQAVFPQAVRTRQDGTLAVDYEKLATLAFGAIKELVKRVEALEAK